MMTETNKPLTRSRTLARVAAVQALFQSEQNEQHIESVKIEFFQHRKIDSQSSFDDGHIPDADLNLFEEIIRLTAYYKKEINNTLRARLPQAWPLERLDPVLRAILRASLAEMTTKTPTEIIINEYLDVSHSFFDGDEAKMVNAILDKFSKDGRSFKENLENQ